jgi:prepilin-type N-terminal cleavage/methylation domain-containing protein
MLTDVTRRGFTLVEVLLATVITVITTGALFQSLLITQRVARSQGNQLRVQASVRGAMLAVLGELRELSTVEAGSGTQNDVQSISPTGIVYRAMRGTGFTCQSSGSNQLRIQRSTFSGFRDPQPRRDSLLVYLDAPGPEDPAWIPLAIAAVSSGGSCAGGVPAITLTVSPLAALDGQRAGLPVRTFEPMELRAYQAEGRHWLGARSIGSGEPIQPLFGPLSDANGFRLRYRGRTGSPTNDPRAIRSIVVTVQGKSEERPEAEEQLTAEVVLRNAGP